MANLQDYKFIAILLPNSVMATEHGNGEIAVSFSLVLNVNSYCDDFITEDRSEGEIQRKYGKFYEAVYGIKDYWDKHEVKIGFSSDNANGSYEFRSAEAAETPFSYSCNDSKRVLSKNDYQKIKDQLWANIFPAIKVSSPEHINQSGIINSLANQNVVKIGSLMDHKIDGAFLDNFSLREQEHYDLIKLLEQDEIGVPKSTIKRKLQDIFDFGKQREKLAYNEKVRYLAAKGGAKFADFFAALSGDSFSRQDDKVKEKLLIDLINFEKNVIKDYVSSRKSIDMDEILHSVTAVSTEPALMRLLGFIKDYKVIIPRQYNPKFSPDVNFFIKPNLIHEYIHFPTTSILGVSSGDKVAFLVNQNPRSKEFFSRSILLSKGNVLTGFDKLAKASNLIDHAEKVLSKTVKGSEGTKEALTRGIIYGNPRLSEIIQPYEDDPTSDTNISLSTVMTDDHVVRGHRVAVKIDGTALYSLTSRSIEMKLSEDPEPFYKCGVNEGCIHFDSPASYMKDGELKMVVSDELFEYSGELLKLKSAFSRATKRSPADDGVNHHDDGMNKSFERFDGVVDFRHFPFVEKLKPAKLNINYSIPTNFNENYAPRLRYGKKYQFAVYQEYLNGGGLATTRQDTLQATLQDILNLYPEKEVFAGPIEFIPLESKKVPLLFHKAPVSEIPDSSITERPALDHLAVLSNNLGDGKQYIAERHVLPPKIEIESAYWHGLLSEPKMDNYQSFLIKRRSNCKFLDQKSYNAHVKNLDGNGNHLQCQEGCKAYCGGTQMELNYIENHIKPRFITDPEIKGFSIELYWDDTYNIPVCNPQHLNFSGQPGLSPSSYLLRAIGSANETFIQVDQGNDRVNICVKKGMTIYAKLINSLSQNGKGLLDRGWWEQINNLKDKDSNNIGQLRAKATRSPAEDKFLKQYETERNPHRAITISHAVKEPLVSPKIIKLYSSPRELKKIGHIRAWLERVGYKVYRVGSNVISLRIDKNTGELTQDTSFAKVNLVAHFERLDAIKKFEFLQEVIPTGGLELWMRKEVYDDDPKQFAFDPLTNTFSANHIPSRPVLPFNHPDNKFILEHKIEFSPEIMQQLRDDDRLSSSNEAIDDAFRSIVSALTLTYDLRTLCFEEREYYLKGISKFRGFFSDKSPRTGSNALQDLELEVFSLPKITSVIAYPSLRFKAIVLNNKCPEKPDVAYAITTIEESRKYPGRNFTETSQKGNIVSLYFKRNRLSSGKDERIGLITESSSEYNEWFKQHKFISTVGRDILSDQNSVRSQFLKKADVLITKRYDAEYDDDLGIAHYLPEFDYEKQLWKIEVDLNVITIEGRQLHNPFINFALVHYQPLSINHNNPDGIAPLIPKLDCRLSEVVNSAWCYLLPERKLSIFFDELSLFQSWGSVDFTLSFDFESLHRHKIIFLGLPDEPAEKVIVRTNFIFTVQGSNDELTWKAVESKIDNELVTVWSFHHALLNEDELKPGENSIHQKLRFRKFSNPLGIGNNRRYRKFRARFIEVEWFSNESWSDVLKRNEELLTTDILDNEDMRLRYVELIY
ncbi:hypothetical protein D3C87_227110 [compost metagenome]